MTTPVGLFNEPVGRETFNLFTSHELSPWVNTTAEVVWRSDFPRWLGGKYDLDGDVVSLNANLPLLEVAEVAAHEYGHARWFTLSEQEQNLFELCAYPTDDARPVVDDENSSYYAELEELWAWSYAALFCLPTKQWKTVEVPGVSQQHAELLTQTTATILANTYSFVART